jgi:hypothetical protein
MIRRLVAELGTATVLLLALLVLIVLLDAVVNGRPS